MTYMLLLNCALKLVEEIIPKLLLLHLVGFYITLPTLMMHGQTQIKPTKHITKIVHDCRRTEGKREVHPRTDHEGPERESAGIALTFFNLGAR